MKISLDHANKTLALAGLFQAAHLINQTAFNHSVNDQAFQASIESIFKIYRKDVPDVFGNTRNVQLGLSYIIHYGRPYQSPFGEKTVLRYILYMTKYAKKILSDQKFSSHIRHRLTPIISQATHLGTVRDSVIQALAALYRQIFLSQYFEIPVGGKINAFKNSTVLNKIHVLLIAGIRAAILWYQVDASRLDFFSRARLKNEALFLLKLE